MCLLKVYKHEHFLSILYGQIGILIYLLILKDMQFYGGINILEFDNLLPKLLFLVKFQNRMIAQMGATPFVVKYPSLKIQ